MSVEDLVKTLKKYLLANGPQSLPRSFTAHEKQNLLDDAIECVGDIFLDRKENCLRLPAIERDCFLKSGKQKGFQNLSSVVGRLKNPEILKAYPFLKEKSKAQLLNIFVEHAFYDNLLIWGDKLIYEKDVHSSKQETPTLKEYRILYDVHEDFQRNYGFDRSMKDLGKINKKWPLVIKRNPLFFDVTPERVDENENVFVFDLCSDNSMEHSHIAKAHKETLKNTSKSLLSVYLLHYLRSKCDGKASIKQMITAINDSSPAQIFYHRISSEHDLKKLLKEPYYSDKLELDDQQAFVTLKSNSFLENLCEKILSKSVQEEIKTVSISKAPDSSKENLSEEDDDNLEGFIEFSKCKKHFLPNKNAENQTSTNVSKNPKKKKVSPKLNSKGNNLTKTKKFDQFRESRPSSAQQKKAFELLRKNYDRQKNPKYKQANKQRFSQSAGSSMLPGNRLENNIVLKKPQKNNQTKPSHLKMTQVRNAQKSSLPPPFPDYKPSSLNRNTDQTQAMKVSSSLLANNSTCKPQASDRHTNNRSTVSPKTLNQSDLREMATTASKTKPKTKLVEMKTVNFTNVSNSVKTALNMQQIKREAQSKEVQFIKKIPIRTNVTPKLTGLKPAVEMPCSLNNRSATTSSKSSLANNVRQEHTLSFTFQTESSPNLQSVLNNPTNDGQSDNFPSHLYKPPQPFSMELNKQANISQPIQSSLNQLKAEPSTQQENSITPIKHQEKYLTASSEVSSDEDVKLLDKNGLIDSVLSENKIHVNVLFLQCQKKQNTFRSIKEMLSHFENQSPFKLQDCWVEKQI